MAGEFSFVELVQAHQDRRKRVVGQTVSTAEATISRSRDPSSVQPSIHSSAGPSIASMVSVMPSVKIEVREPMIPSPAVPVPESSSDEEPISLKRRGKKPATSDLEKVPLKTRPCISESSDGGGQTLNLPHSFLGTTVPIVPAPRKPR